MKQHVRTGVEYPVTPVTAAAIGYEPAGCRVDTDIATLGNVAVTQHDLDKIFADVPLRYFVGSGVALPIDDNDLAGALSLLQQPVEEGFNRSTFVSNRHNDGCLQS